MIDIEEKSVTHLRQKDIFSKDEIKENIHEIRSNIIQKYGKDTEKYNELNTILDDLSDFSFGRFLIRNRSLSGYWTHYVMTGYKEHQLKNKTEEFMLLNSPGVIASRERLGIFQQLLKKIIKENSVCCSIPCGLMTEFITLDIDKNIKNLKFFGIDLDITVFDKAKELVKKYDKSQYDFSFIKEDAWSMNINDEFDILTSNGLNIYEKNDERVIELYKNFFNSLKPGGIFIGSSLSTHEEWDKDNMSQEYMKMGNNIYIEILNMSCHNYRTIKESENQLKSAGFERIEFYWDTNKIFYTFMAIKKH